MMMMMKGRVGGSFDYDTSMEAFETYDAEPDGIVLMRTTSI